MDKEEREEEDKRMNRIIIPSVDNPEEERKRGGHLEAPNRPGSFSLSLSLGSSLTSCLASQ